MSVAVMDWATSCTAFNGATDRSENDRNYLCRVSHEAAAIVAATPAATLDDLAVKTFMLALVECERVGPQPLQHGVHPGYEEYEETKLWQGVIADLPRISPAVRYLINSATA